MSKRVTIIGPVYPYRAGIAYCTTRLAEELAKSCEVSILSFSRQFPKFLYPGGEDVDQTLMKRSPAGARFLLDIVNPLTWLAAARLLRREKPDVVIVVWWVWVWALPYRVVLSLLPKSTRVILQCHNIGDKEPAAWKGELTNWMLRRADALVVHAATEAAEARRRIPEANIVTTFLPVHELGMAIPTKALARKELGIDPEAKVALCFGHVRPFKGLDIALRAWAKIERGPLLLVGGEVWWKGEGEYRALAEQLQLPKDSFRFDFRFIPDAEIATWFTAADVVLAPYRIEAQSGVALTAFHFARPVIASRVGGLPEIIEEGVNGMLIEPESPDDLARAVDAFFAGGNDMTAGAVASAARYSWEEYAAILKRLL